LACGDGLLVACYPYPGVVEGFYTAGDQDPALSPSFRRSDFLLCFSHEADSTEVPEGRSYL